jgi:AcrR family transcriptional regulator
MSKMTSPSPLRASPLPSSRIGKSERTRAAILNAALDLLWSHPFHEMTISTLMAPTDVGRSAFYKHFDDIHEVMRALLDMLRDEIFAVDQPWLTGIGDPVALIDETLLALVQLCYQRGPFFKAITDAAATDKRVEASWRQFCEQFDAAGFARIEADQKQGLIPDFDPSPVIFGLNRLDAYTFIEAFGQRPRRKPKPVHEALARIWISTLYGQEFVATRSSKLVRK